MNLRRQPRLCAGAGALGGQERAREPRRKPRLVSKYTSRPPINPPVWLNAGFDDLSLVEIGMVFDLLSRCILDGVPSSEQIPENIAHYFVISDGCWFPSPDWCRMDDPAGGELP